jgi:PAS domain-containing protein
MKLEKGDRRKSAKRVRASEKELTRLNRILQTLYQCNHALIHATDEHELLQSVCETLVKVGGIRMAWVGHCLDDPEKTVRPIAMAGHGLDYVEAAKISWSDETETGRGPTGIALRTGNPYWAKDMRTDPTLAPWRSAAITRQYASCVALPLIFSGTRIGALSLYANTTTVIFVKDLELRYLLVNQEFERRHHVQRDEVRGKSDFDIHPRAVAGTSKFLLRDGSGKPYAVCGIATDITDRKRTELELRRTEEEMREAQAALTHVSRVTTVGELAASIARELNQPLTGVVTNSNACVRWLDNVPPNIEAIEAITSVDRDDRILQLISRRQEAGTVLVAVRDSGPGLGQQTFEEISKAFFTTKPQGMGMGLSISRSIGTSHGGRLWAEANADRGTTFQFTLPSGDAAEPKCAMTADVPSTRGRSCSYPN